MKLQQNYCTDLAYLEIPEAAFHYRSLAEKQHLSHLPLLRHIPTPSLKPPFVQERKKQQQQHTHVGDFPLFWHTYNHINFKKISLRPPSLPWERRRERKAATLFHAQSADFLKII